MPTREVPWDALDRRPGRSVFCTSAWNDFLHDAQGSVPVVGRVTIDRRPVGWFTGGVVRRFGLRMLGSPLPGWGTSYMGFDWDDPAGAAWTPVALAAVRRWSLASLRCAHFEILVRADPADLQVPAGMSCDTFHSYQRELVDDDTMLAAMSTNARRNIRRAERRGVSVEIVAGDGDGFVEQYYDQARHAFARRGTTPTYDIGRVRSMVQQVHPSGNLLLLRARTSAGRVAATGISAGVPGGTAVFLMGAADPHLLDVRPNEAVMWEAMREWRDRGARTFDFGGGGSYKEKFGCRPVESAWFRSTVLPGSDAARSLVKHRGVRLRRLR